MRVPVTQKHDLGCGIACTAFVSRLTYEQVMILMKMTVREAAAQGTYCRDIVDALDKAGIFSDFRYLKPRLKNAIYKDGTIVFIARSKRYPSGHYLCRWKDRWMDPWINGPPCWDIHKAEAGWRKRLPGKAIYAVFIL